MRSLAYPFALSFALSIYTGVPLGAGWTNTSTGLTGSVPALSAVVVDRGTGSTLYTLTSANSIFKGMDGGVSCSALGNIIGVLVLALDPTSASIVYAGTARGVFKARTEATVGFPQGCPARRSAYWRSIHAIQPLRGRPLQRDGLQERGCRRKLDRR